MSQDHMCYNMSVISIKVRGIFDLNASAEILCPTTGNLLGHLSLRQTLMKYLKLQDGIPMCAELHQRGLQGPVDMIIPNTAAARLVLRCSISSRLAICITCSLLLVPPPFLSRPSFAD